MLFWTSADWIRSVMFHTNSYWSFFLFLRKTTQKLRPQSNPWPREVAAHEGALLLQRQEEGQEEGADRKRHTGSNRRSIVWSVRACCRDPRGYCHRGSHWADSTADSASPSFTGMPVRRSAAPQPPPGPDLCLDPPAATWYRLGSRNPPLQAPHARRHHRRRRKEAKEGGNWKKKQMAGGRMLSIRHGEMSFFYVLLLICYFFFFFLRPFETFPSLSPIFKGPFFSLDLLRSQQNELYENNKHLYPPW